MVNHLEFREVRGGCVTSPNQGTYLLEIPPTDPGTYTLAQLDDYMHLSRSKFPYRAPFCLQLEARVSAPDLPGTWGFGFWNDPFSAGFGTGGMQRFLPVLPNAAWFFHGSAPNHLSLREDLPGSGFHAKVFCSPLLPSLLSLLAVPAMPLLLWPAAARLMRNVASLFIHEEAIALQAQVTDWHHYGLHWRKDCVEFVIDKEVVFRTSISPCCRMGLVIWIDNQYLKFTPDGHLGNGFLATREMQSVVIQNLMLDQDCGYD